MTEVAHVKNESQARMKIEKEHVEGKLSSEKE